MLQLVQICIVAETTAAIVAAVSCEDNRILYFSCIRGSKTTQAVITIAIQLRQDYDTSYTTISQRIRLRRYVFDCDTTTIRLRRIARLLPFDTIRREQKNERVNSSS